MRRHPVPPFEKTRLAALKASGILSAPPDPCLQDIVDELVVHFDCETALVSIVDANRQVFIARRGMCECEMSRDRSICADTILTDGPLTICDTHADPRFADHPVVVGPPHVRFYAGSPIALAGGFRVGSLCVLDPEPRPAPPGRADMALLQLRAREVAEILDRARPGGFVCTPRHDSPCMSLSQAARTEFLELVGHELRTPLTVLSGYLEVLDADLEDPGKRDMVAAMRRASDRLGAAIESLLNFSELGSGDRPLDETDIELRDLIGEIVAEATPGLTVAGKRLRIATGALPARLRADRAQMGVALGALLANAEHHGGATVGLNVRRAAGGPLLFEIWDTGRPLPDDEADGILEPFVLAGEARTRDAQGLGIGLPLARRIVEAHGGTLGLERGDTNTFFVRLPAWRLS